MQNPVKNSRQESTPPVVALLKRFGGACTQTASMIMRNAKDCGLALGAVHGFRMIFATALPAPALAIIMKKPLEGTLVGLAMTAIVMPGLLGDLRRDAEAAKHLRAPPPRP